jgi:hypothetical protein
MLYVSDTLESVTIFIEIYHLTLLQEHQFSISLIKEVRGIPSKVELDQSSV